MWYVTQRLVLKQNSRKDSLIQNPTLFFNVEETHIIFFRPTVVDVTIVLRIKIYFVRGFTDLLF